MGTKLHNRLLKAESIVHVVAQHNMLEDALDKDCAFRAWVQEQEHGRGGREAKSTNDVLRMLPAITLPPHCLLWTLTYQRYDHKSIK